MKTFFNLLSLVLIAHSSILSTLPASEPVRATSVPGVLSLSGAGSSFAPLFSADGRFVVFTSQANNLVTNDDLAPHLDVFVRDLVVSNTTLVSVNSTGIGGGNDNSVSPSISSNGQLVVFESAASNLAGNDTNYASDIFARDLVSGVTTLVSVNAAGTASANGASTSPLISADGHSVVFESVASDLAGNDTNRTTDIFARDLQTGTTVLVSVNAAGTGSGNGRSDSPSMTPDGRFVAFVSSATDLVAGTTNTLGDIFVRDLETGTTYWASTNLVRYPSLADGYRCVSPALSADGHFLAFKAVGSAGLVALIRYDLITRTNLRMLSAVSELGIPPISADGRYVAYAVTNSPTLGNLVYRLDTLTFSNAPVTSLLNFSARSPSMTPDGRWITFLGASNFTDLASPVLIYVRDYLTGSLTSFDPGASKDLSLLHPVISADGGFVAFDGTDDGLVPNDVNRASDVFVRDLVLNSTRLVSQRHLARPETTGLGTTFLSPNCLSADGRFVAFSSFDSSLAAGDTNGWQDVFVRDLLLGTNLPVSAAVAGPDISFSANLAARQPAISANGQYVSFVRRDYTSVINDVLIRQHLATGSNAIVNRSYFSGPIGGFHSAPAMSSDGRLVVFTTTASAGDFVNQTIADNNFDMDIILRDMNPPLNGPLNQAISVNRLGTATGNGPSTNASLSPDARWVLFQSKATDLTTNTVSNGYFQWYARDLIQNRTRLISFDSSGVGLLDNATGAVFSADSRYVAFYGATNFTVYRHDLLSDWGRTVTLQDGVFLVTNYFLITNTVVCHDCLNPYLSGDGRLVAYQTRSNSTSFSHVFVKDLQTEHVESVSINNLATAGGNGNSSSPLLSWDGRFVVFTSKANDLVANDNNNAADVFVRDRWTRITIPVSLNYLGTATANRASSQPVLSADGRTIAFQSFASDLVSGDYNGQRDVFVVRLSSGDADGDGMDDDWEMAYFNTLARDGSGDFDSDGQTDLQEFRAGTDPANAGSILKVLSLTLMGTYPEQGRQTTIFWSAAPSKRYQPQFKDDLNNPTWTNLGGIITAGGTTASAADTPLPLTIKRRFYRVALMQ